MSDSSSSRHLNPGDEFGQYRIVRFLGGGGMGEVYEAEHNVLMGHFALKLILSEITDSKEGLERFKREARAMSGLRHPNILVVDDYGETDGKAWLRMELANGLLLPDGSRAISLLDAANAYLRGEAGDGSGQIPEILVTHWMRQLLEALSHAHEFNGPNADPLVHRDVKPANILFKDDSLKLADFGLVHLAGEGWLNDKFQKSMTMAVRRYDLSQMQTIGPSSQRSGSQGTDRSATAIMGTMEYMAPEAKEGRGLTDPRSDLYSAAKIGFQLLTGVREIGVKTPSRIRKGIHKGWDAWITRALDPNPDERFQSAREMLHELPVIKTSRKTRNTALLAPASSAGLGEPASTASLPNDPTARIALAEEPGQKTPAWIFAGAGGLLILLIAIGAFLTWDSSRKLDLERAALQVEKARALDSRGESFAALELVESLDDSIAAIPEAGSLAAQLKSKLTQQARERIAAIRIKIDQGDKENALNELESLKKDRFAGPFAQQLVVDIKAASAFEQGVAAFDERRYDEAEGYLDAVANHPVFGEKAKPYLNRLAKALHFQLQDNVTEVTVRVEGHPEQTFKGDSRISLIDIPDGIHPIEISATGYKLFRSRITVQPDRAREFSVDLEPVYASIRIITTANASIKAIDAVGTTIDLGSADERGRLQVEDKLLLGVWRFLIEAKDHFPLETNPVELTSSERVTVTEVLKPVPGTLEITSVPSGALVLIDGNTVGKTPLKVEEIETGSPIELRVQLSGFREVRKLIELNPAESRSLKIDNFAAQVGDLIVTMPPLSDVIRTSVKVTVDNETAPFLKLATGDLQLRGLEAGTRRIRITADGYEPWFSEVRINDGQTQRTHAPLVRLPSAILVIDPPFAIDRITNVEINGETAEPDVDQSRLVFPNLQSGEEYSIRLEATGFQPWSLENIKMPTASEAERDRLVQARLEPAIAKVALSWTTRPEAFSIAGGRKQPLTSETLELRSAEPLKIVFHRSGYHDETIEFPVPEHGQTFTKHIEMRKLPATTGTILVKTSAAYPGLNYKIGNSRNRVPLNNRIADIPSGNVRVTFDAPGFQPREYTIPRLEPGGEYQLSVKLEPVRQSPLPRPRPNPEPPPRPIFLP